LRWAVLAAITTACYDPTSETCAITCDPIAQDCPFDLVCRNDHRCHAANDEELCAFPLEIVIDDQSGRGGVVRIAADGTDLNCGIGDVNAVCEVTVIGGQQVTLKLEPLTTKPSDPTGPAPDQAVFVAFDGACTNNNECTFTVTERSQVTAHLQAGRRITVTPSTGGGSGVVSSRPEGINCVGGTGDCEEVFAIDQPVELMATPEAPALFENWLGAPMSCATEPSCLIPSNPGDVLVEAVFRATRVTTAVIPPDTGTITIDNDPSLECTSICSYVFSPADDALHSFRVARTSNLAFEQVISAPSTACDLQVPPDECRTGYKDNLVVIGTFAEPSVTVDLSNAALGIVVDMKVFGNGGVLVASTSCTSRNVCTVPADPADTVGLGTQNDIAEWHVCPNAGEDKNSRTCSFMMPLELITVVPKFN
jgi:hypothetical protein